MTGSLPDMAGEDHESPSAPSPPPATLSELMPFAKMLGVVFDHATKDEVRAHLS